MSKYTYYRIATNSLTPRLEPCDAPAGARGMIWFKTQLGDKKGQSNGSYFRVKNESPTCTYEFWSVKKVDGKFKGREIAHSAAFSRRFDVRHMPGNTRVGISRAVGADKWDVRRADGSHDVWHVRVPVVVGAVKPAPKAYQTYTLTPHTMALHATGTTPLGKYLPITIHVQGVAYDALILPMCGKGVPYVVILDGADLNRARVDFEGRP